MLLDCQPLFHSPGVDLAMVITRVRAVGADPTTHPLFPLGD
jgi:hypothetical protein